MLIGDVIDSSSNVIGYLVTSVATGVTICLYKDKFTFNNNYASPSFKEDIVTNKGGIHDHFRIEDGLIHYNADCKHDKAGTIVKMIQVDDNYDYYTDAEEMKG